MITKKKAIVIGTILFLLLGVSIFAYQYYSSKAPIDLLDKFSNGIVVYNVV